MLFFGTEIINTRKLHIKNFDTRNRTFAEKTEKGNGDKNVVTLKASTKARNLGTFIIYSTSNDNFKHIIT